MAMINTDDSDASQQKCQRESHVVVVVHRTHEHREYNHCEYQSGTSRKDVDSIAVQAHGMQVRTLAPPGPLAGVGPYFQAYRFL